MVFGDMMNIQIEAITNRSDDLGLGNAMLDSSLGLITLDADHGTQAASQHGS